MKRLLLPFFTTLVMLAFGLAATPLMAAAPYGNNLLTNPSCDNNDYVGWERYHEYENNRMMAYDGSWQIDNQLSSMTQTVDLLAAGFTAAELDNASRPYLFGSGNVEHPKEYSTSNVKILVRMLNASGTTLATLSIYEVNQNNVAVPWRTYEKQQQIPSGTRKLQFYFEGYDRMVFGASGYRNGTRFDDMWMSLSTATNYTVKSTPVSNGTFKADRIVGVSGQTMKITASPAAGYSLKQYIVKKSNNEIVPVNSDGTFTMPAGNVTISGEFWKYFDVTSVNPFFDGFEDGSLAQWSQQSEVGTEAWVTNKTETTYNRTPYAGSYNATLRYSNTDWLFTPVYLTANLTYAFEMYARQDGTGTTNTDITVMLGNVANSNGMTSTIVAKTGLTNGNYQKISGSIKPTVSGNYVLGIKGFMNGTPWHISIDNIKMSTDITITCASVANGSFSVNKPKAIPGETVTITATPASGYALKAFNVTKLNGESISVASNNTFIMPAGHEIVVSGEFSKLYNITKASTQYGTFSVDKAKAVEGEKVKLTPSPSAGYVLKAFTVKSNGVNVAVAVDNSFIMPAGFDVIVSCVFWKGGFEVTVQNEFFEGFEAGNLNEWSQQSESSAESWIAETNGEYNPGYAGNYNARLIRGNTDWLFTSLYLTANITYDFEMFARQAHRYEELANITVMVGSAASKEKMTSTIVGTTGITNGAYQKLTGSFTPTATGAYFLGIKGFVDYNSMMISIDNIAMEVHTTVKCLSVANGSFVVDKRRANPGDKVKITANPTSGYIFNSYNVRTTNNEIVAVNSDGEFIMPVGVDVTVSGDFWKSVGLKVSFTNVTGGTFSVDKSIANYGETVKISVNPTSGYALKTFVVKNSNKEIIPVDSDGKFIMPAGYDVIVSGEFWETGGLNVFCATVENGSFTVDKPMANPGDKVKITLNPAFGYVLKEFKVTKSNGKSITVASDSSFTMPAGHNVAVSAVFMKSEIGFNVDCATVLNGSFTVDKPIAKYGEKVKIIVNPSAQYSLKLFVVTQSNGDAITVASDSTFIMPFGYNVTVSGEFWKTLGLTISCPNVANGLFSADKETANYGDIVKITVIPAAGYVLKAFNVTQSNGDIITVAADSTFVMPFGYDVIVSGEFWKGAFELTEDSPFFEGFESGNLNQWTQQSERGYSPWFIKEKETGSDYRPLAGNNFAALDLLNTYWLFTTLYLNANTVYDFEMYARQNREDPYEAGVEVKFGRLSNSNAMTSTIVNRTGLTNADYQLISNSFTPTETGVYTVGIKGTNSWSPLYISIDNIKIEVHTTVKCAMASYGSVSVDKPRAIPGDEVKIIVNPELNYSLNKLYVIQSNGDTIALATDSTFIMPVGYEVVISSEFWKVSEITQENPFFEGFEVENLNEWTQQSEEGYGKWEIYENATQYDRSPYAGSHNINLGYDSKDWLFTPVDLKANTKYDFEMYARQYSPYSDYAKITVMLGNQRSSDAMISTIVAETNLSNGEYQKLSGSFTPTESGVYVVGIKGYTSNWVYSISLDNIRMSIHNPVTCAIVPNGTFSVDKPKANPGDVVKITANPDLGFVVKELYVIQSNGDTITINSDSAFIMPAEYEVTVSGAFWKITGLNVSCLDVVNGSLSVDKPIANYNDTVKIVMIPADGYSIKSIHVTNSNGDKLTLVTDSTFIMPFDYDVTVSCEFWESFEITAENPFVEGFESGSLGQWGQQSENGDSNWVINKTATEYNRTPYDGDYNATLSAYNTDWLFTPLSLKANTKYDFEMYARQSNSSSYYTDITVMLGNLASNEAMASIIVGKTEITDGDYQKIAGSISPSESGIYVLGIKGYVHEYGDYLSIDNIRVNIHTAVTCANVLNGTFSVDKPMASPGDTVKITASPALNFTLKELSVTNSNNEIVTMVSDSTFIMPADYEVTVSGAFWKTKGLLVSCPSVAKGSFSVDKPIANYGDTIKITVSPEIDCALRAFKVTNSKNEVITIASDSTFIMPAEYDVVVSGVFGKSVGLNITCTSSTNGVFSVNKLTGNAGDTIKLTMNPDLGYALKVFQIINANKEIISLAADSTFIIPVGGDVTISGEFWKQFVITDEKPFFEGFENGNFDLWSSQKEKGDSNWTINKTETSRNRTPYDGEYNATLVYNNTNWLYTPLYLNANTKYDFVMYARQDGSSRSEADITVMLGGQASISTMTTTIVAKTGLTNGNYQKVSGTFTTDAAGDYVLGIRGYIAFSPYYISIDNIKVNIHNAVTCINVPNGTFSVDKPKASPGDTVKITINPAPNYSLKELIITKSNNEIVTMISDSTFIMPTVYDVTISGAFWRTKALNVTCSAAANGAFVVDKPIANYGDTVKITVNPEFAYGLKSIKVTYSNNRTVNVASDSTFIMPAEHDVTVSGVFWKGFEVTIDNPFVEGFENGNTNSWDQQSVIGTYFTWDINNLEDYNRTPRTGMYNATLLYNTSRWLFTPLYMNENVKYDLEMFARQDWHITDASNIVVMFGKLPNNESMTSAVVATNGLSTTDYQKISGSFIPTETGVYVLGIKGSITNGPMTKYLSIDDISVKIDNFYTAMNGSKNDNKTYLYAIGRSIIVANANPELKAQVYDVTGNCIANTLDRSISVPITGLYIVRIGGETHKVMVK